MNGRPEQHNGHKRLGQILLECGYLTEAKLQEALQVQAKATPKRLLGQILVSRGFVTSAQLQIALAKQKTVR